VKDAKMSLGAIIATLLETVLEVRTVITIISDTPPWNILMKADPTPSLCVGGAGRSLGAGETIAAGGGVGTAVSI
jgi:hypothetical protein